MLNLKKVIVVLTVTLMTVFVCACGSMDELSEKLTVTVSKGADRIVYSEDIDEAIAEVTTVYVKLEEQTNIEYNVFLDGTLLSDSGFYAKGCNTLKTVLNCMQSVLIDPTGYFTTAWTPVSRFDAAGNEVVIGQTCFTRVDDFFAQAALGNNIGKKAIKASEAIQSIAEKADDSSVTVFITNLAMKTEDEPQQILSVLKPVVRDENCSVGLVAIRADFNGSMLDLPFLMDFRGNINDTRDGKYGIEIEGQRPLYAIFMGEKNAVFQTMDDFLVKCERNEYLSEPGQVRALYYYKYDYYPTIAPADITGGEQLVSVSYSGKLDSYADTECDLNYVFAEIPEDVKLQTELNAMTFKKVYNGILFSNGLETEKDNLHFSMKMPYVIRTTTAAPKSRALRFAGREIDLDMLTKSLIHKSYKLELSDKIVAVGERSGVYNTRGWKLSEEAGKNHAESIATLGADNIIRTTGTLDITTMVKDVPVLYKDTFCVDSTEDLTSELFASYYDVAWLKDWQMDVEKLEKDWHEECVEPDEALKTPFVETVFGETGLLSAAMQTVNKNLKTDYENYEQSAVYGLVIRDQALTYDSSREWDADEDFGWAFSRNEVKEINEKNK